MDMVWGVAFGRGHRICLFAGNPFRIKLQVHNIQMYIIFIDIDTLII